MIYNLIFLVIGLVVGIILGSVTAKSRIKKKNTKGTLKTAYDPVDDNTYLFLELNPDSPPKTLVKEKWVVFDVSADQVLPQK